MIQFIQCLQCSNGNFAAVIIYHYVCFIITEKLRGGYISELEWLVFEPRTTGLTNDHSAIETLHLILIEYFLILNDNCDNINKTLTN